MHELPPNNDLSECYTENCIVLLYSREQMHKRDNIAFTYEGMDKYTPTTRRRPGFITGKLISYVTKVQYHQRQTATRHRQRHGIDSDTATIRNLAAHASCKKEYYVDKWADIL